MAAECAKAMASGCDRVMFVIPKGGMPKAFPQGELANEVERNGVVERCYWFNPERVLEWLIRWGMIEAEMKDGKMVLKETA